MKKPKAILFDLCDTLFLFDPQKLPMVRVNGQEIRSTTGLVHQVLAPHVSVPFEAFYTAFVDASQEITHHREMDHREVTSLERFQKVLHRLDLAPDRIPPSTLMQAVLTHMNTLASALFLPPSHRTLVEKMREKYRIGIITNFDHPPTVHQLLRREGLETFFETVVISADVGWRKPRPEIFQRALDLVSLKAGDTIFVGNDLKIDVGGANAVGIPAVWFNRHGETPPSHLPMPHLTLSRLEELEKIL
jgi:HAD superfamily hydrolase (TIGR01509 family)